MAWWANGKVAPVMMGEVCNKTVFDNEEQQPRELPKVGFKNKHMDKCQSGRLLSEWRFESSSEPQKF